MQFGFVQFRHRRCQMAMARFSVVGMQVENSGTFVQEAMVWRQYLRFELLSVVFVDDSGTDQLHL
jgi:hypothetical protein